MRSLFLLTILLTINSCHKPILNDNQKIKFENRMVTVKYKDRNNNEQVIKTMDVASKHILNIMRKLDKIKFNIENISSYKYRTVKNNDNFLSIHSFGLAIDLNVLKNPFIDIDIEKNKINMIVPEGGMHYLNRKIKRPGKNIVHGIIDDNVVKIFRENGFQIWGGDWDYPIDYMHFQTSRDLAIFLHKLSYEDGQKLFDLNVKYLKNHSQDAVGNNDIISEIDKICDQKITNYMKCHVYLYLNDQKKFFELVSLIAKRKIPK